MPHVSRRALLGGLALFATPALASERRIDLRAGYVPGFEAAPLFTMLGEGWPAAAGIDIAPIRFSTAAELTDALARGVVDAYWGPVSALAAGAPPARIVAGTTVEDIAVIAAGAGFARLASDPARPMADAAVRHWLAATARRVEIVALAGDGALDALAQGAVDAVAVREPVATLAQARGLRAVARGAEIFPDQPAGAFALSTAFLDAHPAQSRRLVTHAVRAERLFAADPARAAAPVIAALAGDLADAPILAQALAHLRFQPDPERLRAAAEKLGAGVPAALIEAGPYRRLHV
ncbi:MAG: ABC transporter substrate-binding protein [Azospirillum sp.]|nr:ABC transporter substrate-binding protein [Azospirillum sp.]MCZ8124301.1 ABC transporter substrate-binding protein [Magnetospirillum sp.]